MSDNFFRWDTIFVLTMTLTGTTPLSSSRLWISTTVSLATPPSSDCTKTVFRDCQYQASRIWLTCVWYCNIGNMPIVYSKSDTSPTCPNLSPTCPNKFFMSEPSGAIGCWLIHSESGLTVGTIGLARPPSQRPSISQTPVVPELLTQFLQVINMKQL